MTQNFKVKYKKSTSFKAMINAAIVGILLLFVFPIFYRDLLNYVSAEGETSPTPTPSATQSASQQLIEKNKEIEELQRKLDKSQDQAEGLSKEISIIENGVKLKTAQIQKAQLEIQKKEEELTLLQEDIRLLEIRLDRLDDTIGTHEKLLESRLKDEYINRQTSFLEILMDTRGIGDFVAKLAYIKRIQEEDKNLIVKMTNTKSNYEDQQILLQEKKNEVEKIKKDIEAQRDAANKLKVALQEQKEQKDYLLQVTKNDEKRYQTLLDQAKAEYEALQSILSGGGIESSGEKVKEGEQIANVLQGASCNSSGTHLHFMVQKNGSTRNPFEYLKSISSYRNCSGAGGCNAGDKFNPSGDWNWPLKGEVTLTQGYGQTWATKNTWVRNIYSFHNGIDIRSTSPKVYAVEDGTYYRGAYRGTRGCKLQYVRVDHEDKISTYYLHIGY